jgi:predicted amidohydrolase YtcJ
MRELNRLGITSLVDAGGGSQVYPDDYAVIDDLNKRGEMTVRMAYNIFTQKRSREGRLPALHGLTSPGPVTTSTVATARARCWSGRRLTSRTSSSRGPISRPRWQQDLWMWSACSRRTKWPFRIHATYDESIAGCSTCSRR